MKQRTGYPVIDEILDSIAPPETYDRKAQPLVLDDRKQNFAGVATIRAAIFDVLDAEEFYFEWNVLSEDDQNQERERFAAKVIDRISDLQSREGIKLENLCPRHKVEVLPKPTASVCAMCQAERSANGDTA